MITVQVKKLDDSAIIPDYAHDGDAGVDLYSNQQIWLDAHTRELIHTGIAMAIPRGYEGCIRPRSGNAIKKGLTVLNTPGTIDSNYRGEICVILYNASNNGIWINPGDRIAQMVFQKIPMVIFEKVDELDENFDRGSEGFGSSGQ